MATTPMGALAAQDDNDADEMGAAPEGADDGGTEEGAAPGQARLDPRLLELVQLVVARTRDALAASPSELDTALKADPVQAAVQFGTRALRGVATAAEQAGKPLSFEVLVNAGLVVIQDIASIAVEKGYMAEGEIETFLKEVFQQSIAAYARMDLDDGKIDQKDVAALTGSMGS